MPRESYTQGKILAWLEERGGWWVKIHIDPQYMPAGIPDILGCYRGLFIAFELKNIKYAKNPYKALRKEQHVHLQKIIANEGMCFAVTSVEEIRKLLSEVDEILDAK